jgi:hypothetical protein
MSEMMSLKLPESEKMRFKKWAYSLKSENMNQVRVLVYQTIMNTARRAKMFAPIDKGFLRSSIRPNISHNELGGSVYTQREYAPYQEFGTGNKVVAPDDVAAYARTFMGKGIRKVNQRAQPYLFPAWRLAQRELMEKLKAMGFEKK